MRGLFVGRFQPFHNGHLYIIQKALEEVDELVIVIGSAECSFSSKDPFTAGERLEMMDSVMKDLGLMERVKIIPIRDVNRYSIWVDHVLSYIPRIDVVFTNNGLTETLFKEKGIEVRGTELVDRAELSGIVIRKKMMEGEPWEDQVPESVRAIISEVGGVRRLQRISRKGDRP
jgi:nicotinamide-nucleotide adenylyltransferase